MKSSNEAFDVANDSEAARHAPAALVAKLDGTRSRPERTLAEEVSA